MALYIIDPKENIHSQMQPRMYKDLTAIFSHTLKPFNNEIVLKDGDYVLLDLNTTDLWLLDGVDLNKQFPDYVNILVNSNENIDGVTSVGDPVDIDELYFCVLGIPQKIGYFVDSPIDGVEIAKSKQKKKKKNSNDKIDKILKDDFTKLDKLNDNIEELDGEVANTIINVDDDKSNDGEVANTIINLDDDKSNDGEVANTIINLDDDKSNDDEFATTIINVDDDKSNDDEFTVITGNNFENEKTKEEPEKQNKAQSFFNQLINKNKDQSTINDYSKIKIDREASPEKLKELVKTEQPEVSKSLSDFLGKTLKNKETKINDVEENKEELKTNNDSSSIDELVSQVKKVVDD